MTHTAPPLPLTSTQRDIWFLKKLHPSVPLYNIGGYRRADFAALPNYLNRPLIFWYNATTLCGQC